MTHYKHDQRQSTDLLDSPRSRRIRPLLPPAWATALATLVGATASPACGSDEPSSGTGAAAGVGGATAAGGTAGAAGSTSSNDAASTGGANDSGEDTGSAGGANDSGADTAGGAAGVAGTGTSGNSGAGGADAGRMDADIDAPVLAPSCRDSHPDVLFCDNFERPGLPGWSRFSQGTDGKTQRITSPARGSGALGSVKSAPGSSDPVFVDALGGLTSGRLYFRTWLYIPNTFAIQQSASILVLGESRQPLGGVSLTMSPDGLTLQINPAGPQAAKFVTAVPRNQWFCLRIDFPISSSASNTQYHVRIGNQQLVNIDPARSVSNALPNGYDRLWMGINWIPDAQTDDVAVNYDDVVVDTKDIACD